MSDILEIMFAFLFASALAEWRRRRELRNIEKMLKRHYDVEGKSDKVDESTVSPINWLLSSDVRLAVRLEKARRRKEEVERKLAEIESRQAAAAAKQAAIRAKRVEFKAKAKNAMRISSIVLSLLLALSLWMLVRHAHGMPAG